MTALEGDRDLEREEKPVGKNTCFLLKNLWSPKETVRGMGDALGLWDENPIKLDCDDHFTTINVINSLIKRKEKGAMHTYKFPGLTLTMETFRSLSRTLPYLRQGTP